MKADLFNNDQSAIIATVEVPDFPNNPQIVGYKGKYFLAGDEYGAGNYPYNEQSFLEVN